MQHLHLTKKFVGGLLKGLTIIDSLPVIPTSTQTSLQFYQDCIKYKNKLGGRGYGSQYIVTRVELANEPYKG